MTPSVMCKNSVESLLRSFSASEIVSSRTFAMWLKFRASTPISSWPSTATRCEKSPAATCRVPTVKRLDRRNKDARKQEREHHADHQAKAQRTQDNAHQFARQRIDRRAVVVDVRDVRMLVRHDGHSQIHEFTRDRSVLPDFAVHRRQQILRHAHLCPLIRTLEHLPEAV